VIFWTQIVVAGPTPTPAQISIAYASRGVIRSDATLDTSGSVVGDDGLNVSSQSFATFNLTAVSPYATVTGISLELEDLHAIGNPFPDLGCLNVYIHPYGTLDLTDFFPNAPAGQDWQFCSIGDTDTYQFKVGSASVVAAFQEALKTGGIQLRLQMTTPTDDDGVADYLVFSPWVIVHYIEP